MIGAVDIPSIRTVLESLPELDELMTERFVRQLTAPERPVSARAVADHLGLRKTDWVYANAERLGGRRLGDGRKARWRFYLSEVDELLREFGRGAAATTAASASTKPREPRRGKRADGVTAAGNSLLDFEAA